MLNYYNQDTPESSVSYERNHESYVMLATSAVYRDDVFRDYDNNGFPNSGYANFVRSEQRLVYFSKPKKTSKLNMT